MTAEKDQIPTCAAWLLPQTAVGVGRRECADAPRASTENRSAVKWELSPRHVIHAEPSILPILSGCSLSFWNVPSACLCGGRPGGHLRTQRSAQGGSLSPTGGGQGQGPAWLLLPLPDRSPALPPTIPGWEPPCIRPMSLSVAFVYCLGHLARLAPHTHPRSRRFHSALPGPAVTAPLSLQPRPRAGSRALCSADVTGVPLLRPEHRVSLTEGRSPQITNRPLFPVLKKKSVSGPVSPPPTKYSTTPSKS